MKKIGLFLVCLLLFTFVALAHDGVNKECNLGIKVTPERANPEYKKGEEMKFSVLVYPLDN